MRILLVGAGGVGDAIAKIAARRDFFELIVVSDYDESGERQRTVDWIRGEARRRRGRPVRHGADRRVAIPTSWHPSPGSTARPT